jgi:hypothetical protein
VIVDAHLDKVPAPVFQCWQAGGGKALVLAGQPRCPHRAPLFQPHQQLEATICGLMLYSCHGCTCSCTHGLLVLAGQVDMLTKDLDEKDKMWQEAQGRWGSLSVSCVKVRIGTVVDAWCCVTSEARAVGRGAASLVSLCGWKSCIRN